MNNDGRLDLLVTINSVDDGTLLVYEIPDDFRTGEYVSHVLASGFFSRSGLNGGGAPGQAMNFYPEVNTIKKAFTDWATILLMSMENDIFHSWCEIVT